MAEVTVWVANLLPLLVLKSYALRRRTKHKDAFDIVWLLTRWQGGPEDAAREAKNSAIADSHHVEEALTILDSAFKDPAQHGCQQYAIGALSPHYCANKNAGFHARKSAPFRGNGALRRCFETRCFFRGAGRNRTDGGRFAVSCLSTWRRRHPAEIRPGGAIYLGPFGFGSEIQHGTGFRSQRSPLYTYCFE